MWWHAHIQCVRHIVEGIDAGTKQETATMFNEHVEPRMTVRIETGRGTRPTLHVVPQNLLAAMWLQVAGELTEGITFKKYNVCPAWLPYGPGTGHRKTKEFWSDRCRKAWSRRIMKEADK